MSTFTIFRKEREISVSNIISEVCQCRQRALADTANVDSMNAKEQQGDLLLYVHYCRKWLEEKVKWG